MVPIKNKQFQHEEMASSVTTTKKKRCRKQDCKPEKTRGENMLWSHGQEELSGNMQEIYNFLCSRFYSKFACFLVTEMFGL